MAFLTNKTVNRLTIHYGVFALASSGGGVFFGAFLLKSGVAIPAVLAAYALINGLRASLLPVILAAAKRFGLRPLVIFGALALGAQYPILARVHGVEPLLLILCVVTAVGEEFYAAAFHAYFAHVGDAEHRGQQTGLREALYAVVGIFGPIAGGWALTALPALVAFGAVGAVQMLSVLPLLGAPNVAVASAVPGAFKGAARGFVLFVADGWLRAGIFVIWQVALFVVLRESFAAFGAAMALASLAGAAAGMLLGRHIDAGRGVRAACLAFLALAVCILMRALAVGPAAALTANAAGALMGCVYVPTLMTAIYNLAKPSPCPLRFQIAAQAGWHLGRGAACLIAAALVILRAPLQLTILLSLAGALGMLFLLRRYYGGLVSAPRAPAARSR
jgi:DHA1 family inner membrane transport protein